jgi:AcrR family transcriptional regulator
MSKTTPRERRHARTRQEILDAAMELVQEKGPDKLSMRELARRVDYSPAGLYEYFENKDDIIVALCMEADRRLRIMLKAVPESLPAFDYLIELGMAYIRYAKENKEHFLLDASAPPQIGPDQPVPLEMGVHRDGTIQILLKAIQKAVEEGVIAPVDDQGLLDIVYSIFGLAHGLAVLQVTKLVFFKFDYERANRKAYRKLIEGFGPK